MSPQPSLAQLGQSVSELANDLRARADRLGRPDLSRRIAGEAERWAETSATIVVVGAHGAGKSSLIATLTGRPDVYPAGIQTTRPIIVRQHPDDTATLVTVDGTPEPVDVGSLRTTEIDRRRHEYAELGLRAPRLVERATLVDTPGFGGPADPLGHGAYLASRRADALVLALDLGAPISRPDLDAIVRCADRFAELTLVGTRIDRIRGWQRVLDDSHQALAAALPAVRITPLGLSNRLAEAAFAAEDDDEATELLDESGIGDLQRVLVGVGDRLRHVRLSNFNALLDGIVAELTRDGRAGLADAEDHNLRDVERLTQLRSELGQVRDDRSSWFVVLGDAIASARDESTQDLTRAVMQLNARYDERVATWKGPAEALLDEFRDELHTEASAFAARLADRLDQVVDLMVDTTETQDIGVRLDPTDLVHALAGTNALPGASPRNDPQHRLRATGGLVSMATSSTMMMGALHGAGGADLMRLGAYGAATLFAGITTAVTLSGTRRNRTRQQIRAEIRATTQAITTGASTSLRGFFLQVQRGIEGHLKDVVRQRIALLEAEHARAQTASRSGVTERRRLTASLDQELKALGGAAERTAAIAHQLGGELPR